MKKFLAYIMAAAMVFGVCACSQVDVDNKLEKKEDAVENNEEETDKIWDMTVLPIGFSEKPEGVEAQKLTVYEEYEDTYTGYSGTLFKLDFRCDKEQLMSFNDNMKNAGWLGGIDIPSDSNEYLSGKWANDDWYVTIAKGYEDELEDGLNYTVKMEIYRVTRVFPDDILAYFPEFNKFTVVTNDYVGYDEDEDKYVYEFKGDLDDFWCWYFTGAGAFAGVNEQDVEDYIKLLEKENYQIYRYPENDKNILKVEAEKYVNQGKETVTVYMEYNRTLCTMEATYTNNMEYFKQR